MRFSGSVSSFRSLAFVAGVAMLPALAPAAEEGAGHAGEGDHGTNPIPTAAQAIAPAITALIVFGVVLAVFWVLVWPKINNALAERAAKIREEIASAEAARKQAKDALDEYEQSLAQARAESQKMIEQTKAEQAKLAQDLRAKADAELAQMRERALRDIESAKRAAVNEIYADAAALATQIAGKILQREITTDDHQRLVDESLSELQGSAS